MAKVPGPFYIDTSAYYNTLSTKTESFPGIVINEIFTEPTPKTYVIEERVVHYDYAIFTILILLLIVFVWLYAFQLKVLKAIISDFFQFKPSTSFSKEEKNIQKRTRLFLFLIFTITLTILIKAVFDFNEVVLFKTVFPMEVFIGILIVLLYFSKLFVVKALGIIFEFQKEAGRYIAQSFLFSNTLGLFLFPVVILLSFYKQAPPIVFIALGGFIFLSLWLTRSVNTILLGLNNARFSKIYLFIYLCALEILPLIIMTKILLMGFQ